MIFSSDGRRLVTSLLVIITTVIILILLVVNLNCIIFTEATVNTTTTATATATATATQTSTSPLHLSQQTTTTQSTSSSLTHNNPVNVTNTTTTATTTTTSAAKSSQVAASSKVVQPLETKSFAALSTISDNIITGQPVVLAKIKDPSSNLTGINAITMANVGATATGIDSQSAGTNDNLDNTAKSTTMTTPTTNGTNSRSSTSNQDTSQPSPCIPNEVDKVVNATNKLESNETTRYFDIDYAATTFQDSMTDKNAISLFHYLNGFKELMKFFHSLGSIFLFVTSDLEAKIGLLESYRSNPDGGCNQAYFTIQSTIEYETAENLLRDSKRQSGARTILRLHRALEFLSALMMNLSKLEDDAETAPAAREAYTNTLARHHPWTIRTIASFAMRTLPHKKNLVESVLGKEKATNNTLTNEKMLMLSNVTDTLFNVVDKYYEENDLKDLP